MNESDISGFPSEHLSLVWDDVSQLIVQGLRYSDGEFQACDFYNLITEGKMQLWTASDDVTLTGIVVTEIIRFPQKKVCQVVLVAGTAVERWESCLTMIEEWAFDLGVTDMRAYGRPGWKPKARKHGYDMQYCIYTKTLRNCNENTH